MKKVRVALVFKDFAAWCRSSCVGLHVAGYATAEVLRKQGIEVEVFPVRNNIDLVDALDKNGPFTHVIISAPWLTAFDLKSILEYYSKTKFVILSHSNVGFLQADHSGVELLRVYHELSHLYRNFQVGGNSFKFVEWLKNTFGEPAVLLPNLYPLPDDVGAKIWDRQSAVKIGAFGAVRPYKNFMTAAAAALTIQRTLKVPVEFHMSTGGDAADGTTAAIEQLCAGVPNFTLVKHDWSYWDDFIKLVAEMDLLIQMSYTESFNMITADGISVGVPSVVSPAISWAPASWKADPDNASVVAEVGLHLLKHGGLEEGYRALARHNEWGLRQWKGYLFPEECPRSEVRPRTWSIARDLHPPMSWYQKVAERIKYLTRR